MEEKTELNLNNPIFVMYLNLDGLSRQRASEYMEEIIKKFDVYNNATMWFIKSKDGQETRVECLYDGSNKNRNSEIFELLKEINTRIDILSDSKDFDDFKINVRNWRLGNVLDGYKEE